MISAYNVRNALDLMRNYGGDLKIADDDSYSPMAACYNEFVHKSTSCCITCVLSFPFSSPHCRTRGCTYHVPRMV